MKEWEKIEKDITDITIQGATGVAYGVLKALKAYVIQSQASGIESIMADISSFLIRFALLRPTEPLSRNTASYFLWYLDHKHWDSVETLKSSFVEQIRLFSSRLEDVDNLLVVNGSSVIKDGNAVFTHCHSSGVEHLLLQAKKRGVDFTVYLTETRPLYQGRITAEHLVAKGIRTTLMPDSAGSFTLSRADTVTIDLLILGCDAIALDGSCANKVGSYGLALSAHSAKIPVYIVTTLLKVDTFAKDFSHIVLEKRNSNEVWDRRPKGLEVLDLAFDVVPNSSIYRFVTEAGILTPTESVKAARKLYPWMFRPQAALRKEWQKKFVKGINR